MKTARMLLPLLTLTATTTLLPHAAQAQESDSDRHGYIALGAATLPDYEGADSLQTLPFLAGRLEFGERYIALEGVSLRANLLAVRGWELGPLASVTFGRDDDVENAAIRALAPVDDAIEVGAFVARTWQNVTVQGSEMRVELRAVGDASDVHGGWQATASAGYVAPVGDRWRLGGEVSMTTVSDDYASTYFSVLPAGAVASGLPGFNAGGGVKDIGVSVQASYAMNDSWFLTGFVGFRRLRGDFADSPIVRLAGSPDQVSAGLGLGYVF